MRHRSSVFVRLTSKSTTSDWLGRDPAMLWNVGSRAVTKGAAATGKMGRFETELLAQMELVRCLGWAPTPALWRAWASCTG